jgi:hypothetical protein
MKKVAVMMEKKHHFLGRPAFLDRKYNIVDEKDINKPCSVSICNNFFSAGITSLPLSHRSRLFML